MPQEKQFDVEVALDRAMETFWEHGYEATSMARLLERMGIQKGSFYATFSSKHQVFLEALDRYVKKRFAEFEASMRGLGARDAIARMLEEVQKECKGGGKERGCFVVNAALELSPSDEQVGEVVRETLAYHQRWIHDLLKKGREAGEIPDHVDTGETSRTVLGLVIAMRVFARAGMPSSYPATLRRHALSLLD